MRLRPDVVTAVFALLVAAGVLFSTDVPVVEHLRLRLTADLNGDDEHETITLSTYGTGDFQWYWVRGGAARFGGEFFAASGELPKMKLIRIDSSANRKQLLVTTIGPSGCGYVILAFTQGRFFPLLNRYLGACDEPRVLGDGLEIIIWESFWNRTERYTLNKQGTKLNPVSQAIYPVTPTNDATVTEIAGIAVQPLSLKPADCKDKTILKGDRFVVEGYDMSKKRYLLKGSGDRCGWISESDLHPYTVDGLPWAR